MTHTTVLSLGAGRQSTAVALMCVDGLLPPIQHAIFADTGWEPPRVYEHVGRLRPVLEAAGIELHLVSVGSIRDDALDPVHRFASMPLFVQGTPWTCEPCAGVGEIENPGWRIATDDVDDQMLECAACRGSGGSDGKGMVRRQCTSEYKLKPIKAKVRELLGAKTWTDDDGRHRVGRVGGRPGERFVSNWVGISSDEVSRIKPSDVQYMQRVDPLVDLLDPPWSAARCVAWLEQRWPWPVARSACVGCPFHSNAEWRDMRDNHPDEWADAVAFDHAIRSGNGGGRALAEMRGETFLHADRVPLDQANIDRVSRREQADRQGNLLDAIDLPGCDPFGCTRSA